MTWICLRSCSGWTWTTPGRASRSPSKEPRSPSSRRMYGIMLAGIPRRRGKRPVRSWQKQELCSRTSSFPRAFASVTSGERLWRLAKLGRPFLCSKSPSSLVLFMVVNRISLGPGFQHSAAVTSLGTQWLANRAIEEYVQSTQKLHASLKALVQNRNKPTRKEMLEAYDGVAQLQPVGPDCQQIRCHNHTSTVGQAPEGLEDTGSAVSAFDA